ncbi:MAG: ferritin-like domain-containing protein [Acidimicrobiales bacterium]
MTTHDEGNGTPPSEGVSVSADANNRRRFLTAGATVALAAVTAACSKDGNSDSAGRSSAGSGTQAEGDPKINRGDVDGGRDPNNPTAAKLSSALADDLPVASFAAGLEVLAVNTYRKAGQAASAGRLGDVPPAVIEFMTTVMGHHQAALDQWNRALASGGQPEVYTPDADLEPTVTAALKATTDVVGAAQLALMLEDIAAATYLAAIPKLTAPESIALAASIQPIDMQHAAILHFVLGEYPVPDVFAKTDKAAKLGG